MALPTDRRRFRRALAAASVAAVLTAGCGGSGADPEAVAAGALARALLGRPDDAAADDDLRCLADRIEEQLGQQLAALGPDPAPLTELDHPTRRQLLAAALRCVPATALAGPR